MVNLYKRPDSQFWWFDKVVDGKRKRVSTKRTNKREAEAFAATEIKKALDAAQLGHAPELTLRQALFDHYLPTRKRNASYPDLERYCHALCGDRKGVRALGKGGDMPFHDVTKSMIQQYRNCRSADGLSDQSIDHEVKCLSAAYHMLAEDYRVRPGLKFPMARPKGKPRPLTPDEEKALLADLDPSRPIRGRNGTTYLMRPLARTQLQRVDNYDLTVMLLDTGARFGEIAKLTWDFVDTDQFQWVNIYRSKVDNEGYLTTTDRMREVLRRRHGERRNSRYVFPGWVDRVEKDEDVPRDSTRAIRRAMARIGINAPDKVARYGRRDVRSLRDTFATKLRKKGMSLDRLQKLLGHTTPQMTQKYADVGVFDISNEAVSILNEMAA